MSYWIEHTTVYPPVRENMTSFILKSYGRMKLCDALTRRALLFFVKIMSNILVVRSGAVYLLRSKHILIDV